MAKKTTAKKELAEKGKQAMATEEAFLDQFDDAEGFEGEDEDSGAIPRLKLLQKSSPEVDEDSGDYIEGAKVGMAMDSVTKELFDMKKEPIIIVPCYYEKVYNEWIDRDDGGGLVASFNAAEGKIMIEGLERNDKNVPITEDGHTIVDTREHYFLILRPDGNISPVVSGFTSTKVKVSRSWWTVMKLARLPNNPTRTPAMFAFSYELRSSLKTKDAFTYYNWDIKKADCVLTMENGSAIIDMAKAFKDAVISGQRKAVPEAETTVEDNEY